MQSEADAYASAKKAEYKEAAAALQAVNLINAGTPKMRLHVRMYMLYKQLREVDLAEEAAGQLFKQYELLEKMHPDNVEQKQIGDARDATKKYLEAFKKWVAAEQQDSKSPQLAELVTIQNEQGQIAIKATEDYLAAKVAQVDKVSESVFIVADIAKTALTARFRMRRYMQTRDPQEWKKENDVVAKLSTLYEELRKVSLTADDRQRIDRAEKATQEYLANAIAWVDGDKKLEEVIQPELKRSGETVLAVAQTAENNAWKATDDAGSPCWGLSVLARRSSSLP